jgi:nucleotide-binding universal stress UspA family protein
LFCGAGRVQLLYVIEPENQSWEGARHVQLEEETNKARALFRLIRRELNNQDFDGVVTEEVVRQGKKAVEILKQIDEDDDVSVLVLGAST